MADDVAGAPGDPDGPMGTGLALAPSPLVLLRFPPTFAPEPLPSVDATGASRPADPGRPADVAMSTLPAADGPAADDRGILSAPKPDVVGLRPTLAGAAEPAADAPPPGLAPGVEPPPVPTPDRYPETPPPNALVRGLAPVTLEPKAPPAAPASVSPLYTQSGNLTKQGAEGADGPACDRSALCAMLNPGQDIVPSDNGLQATHARTNRRTLKTRRDRSAGFRSEGAKADLLRAKLHDQAGIRRRLRNGGDHTRDERRNSHQTSLLE